MANKLEEARKIINEVDAQMAELFVKRMHAAELVYEYKKEYGLPILDQKREDLVIACNCARIGEDALKEYYIDYLKNLISLSRAYQYRMQRGMKVAYCCVEESFSDIAAGRIFPESTKVSCLDFKSAYDSVVKGDCDTVVLPIEHSFTEAARQTIDLIVSGNLFINGIYELQVRQSLPDLPSGALAHTKNTTNHHHPPIKCNGSDTRNTHTVRFAVLSKAMANTSALCNSILVFTIKNEADFPEKAISIIEKYGYHITVLRSGPRNEYSWKHYCYMEIDGVINNASGADMMEELRQICDQLKIAGTFAPHSII